MSGRKPRKYQWRETAVPADPINPDCAVGKHPACLGDAWDDATDTPVTCSCACHWDTINEAMGGAE